MNYLRDLDTKIPGAENFTYGEFIKHDVSIRLGINNTPQEHTWTCIEKLAKNILQPIRCHFGRIKIISGFRTVKLCQIIGSSAKSNHTLGQAADIEPIDNRVKLFDILEWIHDNLEYHELIAEFFPMGWIHVVYREGGNDKILKLKDNNHNYDIVNLDYIRKIYG